MIEFWPLGIMSVGDDPDDVLAFYRSKGYRTYILPDVDVTPLSADEILSASSEGKDHVTLLLSPEAT